MREEEEKDTMLTKAVKPKALPRSRTLRSLNLLLVLIAVVFSGCASPTRLQWTGSTAPQTQRTRESRQRDDQIARSSTEEPLKPTADLLAPAIPAPEQDYPIDLTSALRLAEAENPLIAEARQRISEALAVQQRARVLLVPTLNLGVNLHEHTGNLQRSSGRILNLNQSLLYVGGGSGAYAAGTVEIPAVSISSPLVDAIFEPLAAHQRVEASWFQAIDTTNSILRDVSGFQFDLIAAEAVLQVRRETAQQGEEVARLTRAYADAQQGREADAERAATELSLIVRETQQAEEGVAVAAARLSHRLHLDQAVRLHPIATDPELIVLVDPRVPLSELIEAALARHPAISARTANVAASEMRYRQERLRPLLPTIWLGFSGGALGGGSNLTPPQLANFGGRTDFDVMAYWTLRNFGFGNLSLQKQRLAEVGQAAGEQARTIAEIRSEVGAAYAEVAATRMQVDLATRRLASAEAGFREDLQRIRNTVGRPIEVVNSLQLLNNARIARIQAVANFNKAQFRLFVAMGSPPPLGVPAEVDRPPPLASPPVSSRNR